MRIIDFEICLQLDSHHHDANNQKVEKREIRQIRRVYVSWHGIFFI